VLFIRLDSRGGIRRWELSFAGVVLGNSSSFCDGLVETGEASLDEGLDDGGWGKAPMLMVFRSFLAGASVAMLLVGRLDAETCCFFEFGTGAGERVGNAEEVLREAAGNTGRREAPDPLRDIEGVAGEELLGEDRALGTGSDGRGVVGGPKDGRDGRGSVVAMMRCRTVCDKARLLSGVAFMAGGVRRVVCSLTQSLHRP
jgi:hypothetical protein